MDKRPFETRRTTEDAQASTSNGGPQFERLASSRRRIAGVHGGAVLVAIVLFYFQMVVIFDVIGELQR